MTRAELKKKLQGQIARLAWLKNAQAATEARIADLRKRIKAKPKPQPLPTGLSEAGAKFIADFEGFSSHIYEDPAGHCTIGYGTLLHTGSCTRADQKEWKDGVTKGQALAMLRQEADQSAAIILDSVRVPLNQNQLDALTSFAYNCGNGAFLSSTLLKELNRGHYAAVPTELKKWVHAGGQTLPGLVRRREAEGKLFTKK